MGFARTLIPLALLPLATGSAIPSLTLSWASRWAFGAAVIGILITICHALHLSQPTAWILIAGLIILGILAGIQNFRKNHLLIAPPSLWNLTAISLLAILWLALAIHVLAHPLHPMHWDAVRIWFNKAKGLFYWTPFQALPTPDFHMKNYPHLGPAFQMFVMKFHGYPAENFSRLIYPGFFAAWLIAFRNLNPGIKPLHFLGLIPAVGLVFLSKSAFTNGYQDGFLGLMAGFSVIHFLVCLLHSSGAFLMKDPRTYRSHLFLGFFFAGSVAFIKVEGLVMSGILVMGFLAVRLLWSADRISSQDLKELAPFFGLWIAMISVWPLLLKLNQLDPTQISGDAYTLSDILHWYRNINRLPAISRYFGEYWTSIQSVFFASILLSGGAFVLTPRIRSAIFYLWGILVLHLLFIHMAFLASRLPLDWHLSTAYERLCFQHFFVFASLLFLCSTYLLKELSRAPGASEPAPVIHPKIEPIDQTAAPAKIYALIKSDISNAAGLLIAIALPLIWLWPRLVHPSFGLIDDAFDLSKLMFMKDHFWEWLRTEGLHGEVSDGRFRPMYWFLRFVAYYLPAGTNPAGWIFLHWINLTAAITLTFLLISRLTRSNWSALIGCALWIFSPNTMANYLRFGPQEILQVLLLGGLFLTGLGLFRTPRTKDRIPYRVLLGALLFTLYFVKEPSVVLFPCSLVILALSWKLRKERREWTLIASINAVLFLVQRILSPALSGYSTHFVVSPNLILQNAWNYFFEMQWPYLFLALTASYLIRIWKSRSSYNQWNLEYWQAALLLTGISFFALILPWTEHVRRYLLVAEYLFTIFMILELSRYLARTTRAGMGWLSVLTICFGISVPPVFGIVRSVQTEYYEGKGAVHALDWLSRQAPKDSRVLVLELEHELMYSTMKYLHDLFGRGDLKILSLSPHADKYQSTGYNISRITKITPDVLSQTDYIFWHHSGIAQAGIDDFHTGLMTQLKESDLGRSTTKIYDDLVPDRDHFYRGTEIWRFDRTKERTQ